jgi:1-acyl-sn-glycerol-3-phosphate acyltransferase
MNGNPFYATGQSLCRLVTTVLFDLKVYGMHHVPRSGGVLIVANHQSFLDPVCIGCQLPRPTSYFAKSELFENPHFGWLIRNLYAFPVRQGEGDISAVREAIKRLQAGSGLVIFPEGGRSATGELTPLEPGVGLIVRKSGVPLVPCVIEGSYAAWPKHRKLPRPHPVRVRFGPRMDVTHQKATAIVEMIDRKLHQMLAELRLEIGYVPPGPRAGAVTRLPRVKMPA